MPAKIRGESSGDLHYGSLPAIARRVGFVYKGDDAGGGMLDMLRQSLPLPSRSKPKATGGSTGSRG